MNLNNETISGHTFLAEMYSDDYFPNFLVDKCKSILLNLCKQIETTSPTETLSLFKLTHQAVDSINQLEEEFEQNDSEIETAAREAIAEDFGVILDAYGFDDVDLEEAIENREW